ncbi:MAG TPA: SBBP repeat-containing protein [bacterium]|nr:SBBP repeat-containing protein [bacterium]
MATAVMVNDSNDIYVVGELGASLGYRYGVIKYTPTGETLWTRAYSFPSGTTQVPSAAVLDHHDNLLVTGFSTGANRRVATVKYKPNGDTAWTRVWDGPKHKGADGGAVGVDAADNVFVSGTTYDSSGYQKFLGLKYDSLGDTLWTSSGGPDSEQIQISAGVTDRTGNTVVTGYCGVSHGQFFDISTDKIRPNGDTAWTALYNGTGYGNDMGRALAVDSLGNVYVAGQSLGNGTGYDAVTLKYDSSGHLLWVGRFPGPSNWSDARALALGPGATTVAVTGKVSTLDGYGGALTILYGTTSAAQEPRPPATNRPPRIATVVRGALCLPATSSPKPQAATWLLDATGRRVATLRAGANDVSWLAPGVYFVRVAQDGAQTVRKVVLTR